MVARLGMAKSVLRHIVPEMLVLLLLEGGLAFGLAYAVRVPAGDANFDLRATNKAAVVAVTVGFTVVLLGLYRPQLFLQARSLLVSTALGGAVAFPAVWAVTSALGMQGDLLDGPDRVWPLKMMLIWIAALFAVRFTMQQQDPRVTRVGAFMRRTRIDELLQLLNVLRGQMSFLGPRPERPHFVDQLAEVIPHYAERSRAKPGLTGWAQVTPPYGASVEDARAKLSYDLFYVRHRSVWLDLSILFATVRVILFQEGAR